MDSRRTQLPSQPQGRIPTPVAPSVQAPTPIEPPEEPPRPSMLDALRQQRTTLFEVGRVARRLSLLPGPNESRHVVRQVVVSFALGLMLALMLALVFAGGSLRLVLGILAGTCAAALSVFAALRGVSRLAQRYGARTLPGSPWLWVGGVVLVAITGTALFSYSVWEVAKVATARPRTGEPRVSIPERPAPTRNERADAKLKRGKHIGLHQGVLYAPPQLDAADGQFDLVIHYHGNADLIEQSVAQTKLNAMIAIINIGDGAGVYAKALQNPFVFDQMLTTIERRAEKQLRLENAQIRRIALSAWSAGFGSVNKILASRSRLDRVDALLLMDTPHGKLAPGTEQQVYLPSIEHFVSFGRRAIAGQKLMVVTHSAIPTEGYASTTLTTDALLDALELERKPVQAGSLSPPPVELSVVKRAFPSGERNWLNVVSHAQRGSFHLYGCTGTMKGDHIAHLGQMSVSVLPHLIERWR